MPSSVRFTKPLAVFFIVLAPWHLHPVQADDARQQAGACVACHPTSGVRSRGLEPERLVDGAVQQ